GWASSLRVQGRVYLTTAVGPEEGSGSTLALHALCLAGQSGGMVWDRTVFEHDAGKAPHGHNKNSQASPTPLIESGRLYTHFGHLGTACLDLEGHVRWTNTSIHYPPVHGNGGSPVLVDDA